VGLPVIGSGTSSVRWIIFSSIIVSFSRTVTSPGRNLIAMRGNFRRLFLVSFVIISGSLINFRCVNEYYYYDLKVMGRREKKFVY
jgi:hypothetical protein